MVLNGCSMNVVGQSGPTAEKKPALLVMLDEPQDFGITWISWFQWYTEWEMRFTIQIFGNIGNIWDSRWFHEWENYGILMIDWWMLFRVTETQNTLFQCLSALDPLDHLGNFNVNSFKPSRASFKCKRICSGVEEYCVCTGVGKEPVALARNLPMSPTKQAGRPPDHLL